MNNPDPIMRAWRLERRRKELGSNNPSCFYCFESNIACLEAEHPVTEKLDRDFKRPSCRNCHRKVELDRDLAHLTKNGLHEVAESKREQHRRYLLLLAYDQELLANLLRAGTI